MKKKILVTGGSGFLGSNFIKNLNLKKYDVISLSRNRRYNKNFINGVKYIYCDISKIKELRKKIEKKYDFIINFSGNINHKNKSETFNAHYQGLKNLIKLIDKKHLRLFIQIGSSLEYGRLKSPQKENSVCRPISHYGKAKYLSSKYIKRELNKFLILRLYQIYGPHQKNDRLIPFVINSCLKNREFPCTEGSQMRDFLFVDDLTDLLLSILKRRKIKSGVYNVGSGKPISVKKLINLVVETLKKGRPNFGKINMRKDENIGLFPSIEKTKKNFKWIAKINISEGLKKTISYYEKK